MKKAVIHGDIKRRYKSAHTFLAYCFTDSLISSVNSSIDQLYRNSKLVTAFLSILAHFFKLKLSITFDIRFILIRFAHTFLAYCFTDSLISRINPSIDQLYRNSKLVTAFLSILALFFKLKLSVTFNISYHFNRYGHYTLHLKEKTFLILENLFKTSGTSTKVFSMHVHGCASCENILPRFQTPSVVNSPPPNCSLNSPESILRQPVPRSFKKVKDWNINLQETLFLRLAKSIDWVSNVDDVFESCKFELS